MIHPQLQLCEAHGTYLVHGPVTENDILTMALRLAQQNLTPGQKIDAPEKAYTCIQTLMHGFDVEVIGALFLDGEHILIENKEIMRGTIDSSVIYPRELMKTAIALNAKAIILYHNHPSGNPRPSAADIAITLRLKLALDYIDVSVIDHVVVGLRGYVSLANEGHL